MKTKILTSIAFLAVALYLAGRASAPSFNPRVDKPQSTAVARANAAVDSRRAGPASKDEARGSYGKLPLTFEPNEGQTDAHVKFLARGKGYALFLTQAEAVLALHNAHRAPGIPVDQIGAQSSSAIVRMKLVGADPTAPVAAKKELGGKVNYFIGNDPARWRSGIPTFGEVTYSNIYPGVNLTYYGNQGRLEYDFVIAPGADPGSIQIGFGGPVVPSVDGSGALRLTANEGEVVLQKPIVYQEIEGQRKTVDSRYVLDDANVVRFALGAYDRDHTLIIDPVLVYSSFLAAAGTTAS